MCGAMFSSLLRLGGLIWEDMRRRRATGGIGLVIYLFLVPRFIIDLKIGLGYKKNTVPENRDKRPQQAIILSRKFDCIMRSSEPDSDIIWDWKVVMVNLIYPVRESPIRARPSGSRRFHFSEMHEQHSTSSWCLAPNTYVHWNLVWNLASSSQDQSPSRRSSTLFPSSISRHTSSTVQGLNS